MKVIFNIATQPGREQCLRKTLNSLKNQPIDEINIYDNGNAKVDLTDNGKFHFLQFYDEPIYYLTGDDDIIYPYDYISMLIHTINKHNCIISYHGRVLNPSEDRYYKGKHKGIGMVKETYKDIELDVCSTGVMGFRTDYFNPTEIYKSEFKKMSDLVFALEAAKHGKKIISPQKPRKWINMQPVSGIYYEFKNKPETQQVKLMKEIIKLKNL